MGFEFSAFRMNIFVRAFCRTVLVLDYIPRYGRYYTIVNEEIDDDKPIVWSKPEWHFSKRGFWGLHILDKMDLLVPYISYHNPDF